MNSGRRESSGDVARVFVGLRVALPLAEELMERVRAVLGREGFRLPRADGLHATLFFLGDLARARLQELDAELRGALAGTVGTELRLGAAGAFPERTRGCGRERVLWIGVDGELAPLHGAVLAAVRRFGADGSLGRALEQEEGRPYVPHVTVARPRGGGVRVPEAFYGLEGAQLAERGAWRPGEVTLFESVRGSGAARYETLERYPFVV